MPVHATCKEGLVESVCVCHPCNKGRSNPTVNCRGVQHLWHTARNEAIAKGGKGSRTLDPVLAIEVCESCSYRLCMVPSCDIFAVQSRSVAFILVKQQ